MKKTLKRILVCLMCIVMFQTAFIPTKIQAAAVKLNKTSVTLATGKNYTLKLQGTKQKPTWKSSNTRIASVSSGGKVTARRTGEAKITAKVGDKTAEYALKVTAKANGTNNKNEKPADGGAVKTGDSNHISGFVVAMLLSIAAIVGVVIFKKRTHR